VLHPSIVAVRLTLRRASYCAIKSSALVREGITFPSQDPVALLMGPPGCRRNRYSQRVAISPLSPRAVILRGLGIVTLPPFLFLVLLAVSSIL